MSLPANRYDATYEDLKRVPDTKIAEIIGGELIVSPRPAGPHAISASGMGMELGPPFRMGRGGPGGWWIIDEPELHLGEHVLVPDLAGWRRERLPVYPAEPFVTLSPDWICEVLSESTCRVDRIRKLPIYAEHEVRHAWLVDPIEETLEVYRLEGRHWLLVGTHEGDAEVRAEPFDAIALQLSVLWDRGEPRPAQAEGL
ncbi:MAG: Uma2 family endonuclease [Candidatus Hydrogenedentota bacterium]